MVTVRRTCRSCASSALVSVLALGDLFLSDFVESAEGAKLPKVPLEVMLCGNCTLLQLRHTTPPQWLYRHYWYKSGVNASMRAALADIAAKAEKLVGLQPGDSVLDIGCNDGTLLRAYRTRGIRRVGFEPGENLLADARVGTDLIINDFFNGAAVEGEKFKIVSSIAMFYDLEDPNRFVADVASCLDPSGVWVIEMHYLPLMLSQNAFDAICHEHLEYYSLTSLTPLLVRHGLKVADVETNEINGGSFRVYVTEAGSRCTDRGDAQEQIRSMLMAEKRLDLGTRRLYEEFAQRVRQIGERLRRFLYAEAGRGKKIYVYGASTKGNTLLQYFELDHSLIRAAADRNPEKWGRCTVGTWIPIVPEEEARAEADYFLILPWHFQEEFQKREEPFLRGGGRLIFPLPTPRVVAADGTSELE